MTEAERRSHQIDRDRRIIEILAVLTLLPLLDEAAERAAEALLVRAAPAAAASGVLNDGRLLALLASAASAASLLGFYRSQAVAAELTLGRPVSMATFRRAVQATPNLLRPAAEHADVINRMIAGVPGGRESFLLDHQARRLVAGRIVRNIDNRVAVGLNRITVGGAAHAYTGPAGGTDVVDSIGRAAEAVRIKFESAGYGSRTSWYVEGRHPQPGTSNTSAAVEALVEALVGEQYELGRTRGAVVAAEDDHYGADGKKRVLWGWTWSSVIDGRRCTYCRKLHGMTAPLDDDAWHEFGPLLHFGCRCSRLERFTVDGQPTPRIKRPDFTEDELSRIARMRRSLTTWWQGMADAN